MTRNCFCFCLLSVTSACPVKDDGSLAGRLNPDLSFGTRQSLQSEAGYVVERFYSAKRHVHGHTGRRIPRRTAECRPRMSGTTSTASSNDNFRLNGKDSRNKRRNREPRSRQLAVLAGDQIMLQADSLRTSVSACRTLCRFGRKERDTR